MAASAGIADIPLLGRKNPVPIAPSNPTFQYGDPNTFSTAVGTQMGDYDRIMDTYKQLGARQTTFNPLTPQLAPEYTQSADVTSSLANLGDLSKTGGYTPEGIADIRSRSVAPIRSIYSTAQRELGRQKNLSGGYSPNFAAASGKMAREQADILSQRTTDTEAGIAEAVARNRLSAAPSFANAAAEQERVKMAREQANTEIINQINQLNESIRLSVQNANNQNLLASAQGQQSLYATAPGLVNTFGNQVSDAAQLDQRQQQINNSVKQNKQLRTNSLGGTFL